MARLTEKSLNVNMGVLPEFKGGVTIRNYTFVLPTRYIEEPILIFFDLDKKS